MKQILVSILIMSLLIFIGVEILTESSYILDTVGYSFSIWKNNLFPSLFPFFVLSEILINYGFVELVGELCKPIMNKLFKVSSNGAFIFIMSIISGFPSNAKYTKHLLEQGLIDEKEASKILTFTHFSNPLFIIGTVSLLFLNDKKAGLIVLVCHYITNVIIGIFIRNKIYKTDQKEHFSFKKAILQMHKKRISNNKPLGTVITNSLVNSINTLLLILGVVTIFLIITTILDKHFHLNLFMKTVLSGFLEMTQGLKHVSLLNVSLKLKSVFTAMILSFGGLSVHTQVLSIISDTKIKYLPFLIARIFHALIAGILVYLTFSLCLY